MLAVSLFLCIYKYKKITSIRILHLWGLHRNMTRVGYQHCWFFHKTSLSIEINIKKIIHKDVISPPQGHPIPRSEDREISPDLAVKTWPQRTEGFPQSSLPLSILHVLICPLLLISSGVMNERLSISLNKTFFRPRSKAKAWHSHCSRQQI